MTPLTPEEQKMIDRILARGIAANDDSPQMGWRDYAAMAVVLLLMAALAVMLHFAMVERVA